MRPKASAKKPVKGLPEKRLVIIVDSKTRSSIVSALEKIADQVRNNSTLGYGRVDESTIYEYSIKNV